MARSPAQIYSVLVAFVCLFCPIRSTPLHHPIEESRRTPLKILLSNDDGWAEANFRRLYSELNCLGYKVVASSTAYNMSGTSSATGIPLPLLKAGQYDSIPSGSSAIGCEPADRMMNYVNSFPVTAVKYGIKHLLPRLVGGAPDLVIVGPNVGNNLGVVTAASSTVGAAREAIVQGFPAIAFSGTDGRHRSYTGLAKGDHSHIYAALAAKVVSELVSSGAPYLPKKAGLNVNFPSITPECATAEGFKFVLSRILPLSSSRRETRYRMGSPEGLLQQNEGVNTAITLERNMEDCISGQLPTENMVHKAGCTVSISVFNQFKLDAGVVEQEFVLKRLEKMLSRLD